MAIHLPPPADRGRKRAFQPRAIAAIAAAWMLMWDTLSWGNLVNGLIVGLVVTLVFPMPAVAYEGTPRPHWVIATAIRFFYDLVVASLQVIWLSLKPGKVAAGSIVEVQLTVKSDLYLTLVAIMTTLVPGSVVVEARRQAGILYIHELLVHDREAADHARHEVLELERRIVKSLGSKREIAITNEARRDRLAAGMASETGS